MTTGRNRTSIKPDSLAEFSVKVASALSKIETRDTLERFTVIIFAMEFAKALDQKIRPDFTYDNFTYDNVTYDDIAKLVEDRKAGLRNKAKQEPQTYTSEDMAEDMDILTTIEARVIECYEEYATLDKKTLNPRKEQRH